MLSNFDNIDMPRINEHLRALVRADLQRERFPKFERTIEINDGLVGSKKLKNIETLMCFLASQKSRLVRDFARAIPNLYGVGPKDFVNEAWAVQHWIQHNIRYVFDDKEEFQLPSRTIIDWAEGHDGADCDCMTILYVSLMKKLGWRDVGVALLDSRGDGVISHAMAVIKLPKPVEPWGDKWIPIELTKKVDFGWVTPKRTKFVVMRCK